jgi:hypothetical protein
VLKVFFPDYYRRFYQPPFDQQTIMRWAQETGAPKETLLNFQLALDQVVSDQQPAPGGEDEG